ncbi:MAG: AraC family transcriptional regulator [Proteobacteria bacterium]|nr:AraC family transcriptional regulator [Pseudomonadota bacterium]
MLLTLTQALQLVGLTPCLFVILFLCVLSARNRQAIIPIFYFLALVCSFVIPLFDLYPPLMHNEGLQATILIGESTLTAFSFLLICQFMSGRVPPLPYWLVLAIPLLGGSTLIYAGMMTAKDACAADETCWDVTTIRTLYHIFSSSFIFLLLIYYASRVGSLHSSDIVKRHKYWLIVTLILLHLLVLAIDMARLMGRIKPEDALFVATMFRLTFIYLVLTSLFRVFYPGLATQMMQMASGRPTNPDQDKEQVKRVLELLEGEKVYRQMRLNRAAFAELAGIGEYQLSRVINRHFNKNFNELLNSYRIEEAKQRLRSETTQITVIGFEVGFNSIASFNRVFKAMVGVSPTEYRNNEKAILVAS